MYLLSYQEKGNQRLITWEINPVVDFLVKNRDLFASIHSLDLGGLDKILST